MDHHSRRSNEAASFDYPENPAEVPKKELPLEQSEVPGVRRVEETAAAQAVERAHLAGSGQANATDAQATALPVNPLLNVPPTDDQSASQTPTITGGLAADDRDLIEKVWVEKAKAIIAQTRTDPHRQSHEINKIKADYQKKRYNRDLKINVE